MEQQLTDFQVKCEQRLRQSLSKIDRSIAGRSLDGKTEIFITGSVSDADVTFWIYKDGADFKTQDVHPVFEKSDFRSLDELADAFIASIMKSME